MSDGHSGNKDVSKTPTTIKIAAKDASQRGASGNADPGPGDPSAAPSVAPQLVDIPSAPTPSQLVVKTSGGKTMSGPTINTIKASQTGTSTKGISTITSSTGPKTSSSKHQASSGGKVSPMASHMSGASGKESTSSKHLSHSPLSQSHKTASEQGSAGSLKQQTGSFGGPTEEEGGAGTSGNNDPNSPLSGPKSGASKSATKQSGAEGNDQTVSTAMQADSGNVHDEDEEGEGEVVQPEEGGSPSPTASASPASIGGASPTASTSHKSVAKSSGKVKSDIDSAPSSAGSTKASTKTGHHRKSSTSPMRPSSSGPELHLPGSHGKGKDGKKKVTKFRYHKRITVRTTGKTSPGKIMDKVNQKDHKVGITPSTIGEMDPQELMHRAGIKGNDKTHWRVRLRQTKRLTKDGKTVTQTKIAYRDSEGNKRVKTSTNPFCKNCGEKLENCRCDDHSRNS